MGRGAGLAGRLLVRRRTARAIVRALALNAILGGALLVSVGGMRPSEPATPAGVFAENGALTGRFYALADARIEASTRVVWEHESPAVSFAAPASPRPASGRPAATVPPPPAVAGDAILEEASKYVGTPYLYGGSTPAGFDCSGFVRYVYSTFGVSLPHSSSAYWGVGTRVSAADALPGDIIVSSGHVAIYAGSNLQIDAPHAGKTVQFREIWQTAYVFVRVS